MRHGGFALALALVLTLALACGGESDGGVDAGGDPGPIDTGWHPDVPPVLPDDACGGGTPTLAFHHGFEPGQILPDDPTLQGFAIVDGGACPDGAGGTRALALTSEAAGAYASFPPVTVPDASLGTPWLSFCLVLDAHDEEGDYLWISLIGDAGDPESVWSSTVGAANPPVVTASLAPWAGQKVQLSLHFSRGNENAEPPRDVRIDSLAIFSCPL